MNYKDLATISSYQEFFNHRGDTALNNVYYQNGIGQSFYTYFFKDSKLFFYCSLYQNFYSIDVLVEHNDPVEVYQTIQYCLTSPEMPEYEYF